MRTKSLSSIHILALSILCLVIGHLAAPEIVDNRLINSFGFFVLLLLIVLVIIRSKDAFALIMILYVCNHFIYMQERGGVFVLLGFFAVAFYNVYTKGAGQLRTDDRAIRALMYIFVLNNVAGWLFKNSMPLFSMLLGVISFFGYLLVFNLTRKVNLTENRIRIFMQVNIFLLLYSLITALNIHYAVLRTSSPLLYTPDERFGMGGLSATSMIGHSELYNEESLLMFLFFVPFLMSSRTTKYLRVSKSLVYSGLILAAFNLIISPHRSGAILAGAAIMSLIVLSPFIKARVFDKKALLLKLLVYVLILIAIFGPLLNMEFFVERLEATNFGDLTISTVTSGEQTNRLYAYGLGVARILSDSWFVGYGWGIVESNRMAWFPNPDINFADFHNLYLSLPMIYGWLGSIAFVGMIVVTLFRLIKVMIKNSEKENYLLIPIFAFVMVLSFFSLNEIKISILRTAHYQMLFWIWLGLANSCLGTFAVLENSGSTTGSPVAPIGQKRYNLGRD